MSGTESNGLLSVGILRNKRLRAKLGLQAQPDRRVFRGLLRLLVGPAAQEAREAQAEREALAMQAQLAQLEVREAQEELAGQEARAELAALVRRVR